MIEIPNSGGDTSFTNQCGAYDALSDTRKAALEELIAEHVYNSRFSPRRLQALRPGEITDEGPVRHPLVRTHPESGRKLLYFNPIRIEKFVGLSEESSQSILHDLVAHCEQPQFVYRHRWSPGDVLLWDNRQTMHKVAHDYAPGAKRIMHRALVYTGQEWSSDT